MNKYFVDEKAIGNGSSSNESSEAGDADEASTEADATNSDFNGSSDTVVDDVGQPFGTIEAGGAGMSNLPGQPPWFNGAINILLPREYSESDSTSSNGIFFFYFVTLSLFI